jgi:hypothetical protein
MEFSRVGEPLLYNPASKERHGFMQRSPGATKSSFKILDVFGLEYSL